jgi:hypothetical protein
VNWARVISPAAKGELAVPHRAEPADMPVDRHIVGRIGEDEVGFFFAKKFRHMLG